MSAGIEKVCVICGQDCSGVSRIKDAQGRYACRTCAEARRSKASARSAARAGSRPAGHAAPRAHPRPAEAAADDLIPLADNASILDDLPAPAEPSGGPCPGCGMPTKPGAVVCMGCGFNAATGAESATRVKERRVREPATRPAAGRVAVGAAAAAGGGALGLGLWTAVASTTGEPWYAMAGLLGVLAGVGMCVVVRGVGTRGAGLASAVSAAVLAVPGLVLFAPEPTSSFEHGLSAGLPPGWVVEDIDQALAMGDDEAVLAGGVWLGIASLAAYAFGRSNPDESAIGDAEATDAAGGTEGNSAKAAGP